MICIIDYGLGNLGSIKNMLKKIGVASIVSSSVDDIRTAEKLILPGVGAFDQGMENLNSRGLIPIINEQVLEKKVPVLGICLGMQLMTKSSEEGNLAGLGWVDAHTRLFDFSGTNVPLPVPNMGWVDVVPDKDHSLIHDLPKDPRFYFVHSFHVCCTDADDALLHAEYGITFTAAFARGNILGVQFHPEKSHKFGMQLLRNFDRGIAEGTSQ